MLCSMPTGKSSSNWLDRLRSSKGFPAGNDLNLEQFLSHRDPKLPNSSYTKFVDSSNNDIDPILKTNLTPAENQVFDWKRKTQISSQNGETEWFGIMSNVLSELFNMGDSNDFPIIHGRKSSRRKQLNPKICVVQSPNAENIQAENCQGVEAASISSPLRDDNSIKDDGEVVKLTEHEDVNGGELDGGDEEERFHDDLGEFSRTEVTVIDTSCRSWKFEKMLFRRRNVWKVRDKKCKSINISSKKRKGSLLGEDIGKEKKLKHSIGQFSSFKEAYGQEGIKVLSNEGFDQRDRMKESYNATGNFSQISKKRFPRKMKKGSSSVILIKNLPTTKKNGGSNAKSILK